MSDIIHDQPHLEQPAGMPATELAPDHSIVSRIHDFGAKVTEFAQHTTEAIDRLPVGLAAGSFALAKAHGSIGRRLATASVIAVAAAGAYEVAAPEKADAANRISPNWVSYRVLDALNSKDGGSIIMGSNKVLTATLDTHRLTVRAKCSTAPERKAWEMKRYESSTWGLKLELCDGTKAKSPRKNLSLPEIDYTDNLESIGNDAAAKAGIAPEQHGTATFIRKTLRGAVITYKPNAITRNTALEAPRQLKKIEVNNKGKIRKVWSK